MKIEIENLVFDPINGYWMAKIENKVIKIIITEIVEDNTHILILNNGQMNELLRKYHESKQ